jgi:hypothetical protein
MQWILNLLGRRRTDLPCVKRLARDGLQVSVLQRDTRCGDEGYLTELQAQSDGKWRTIARFGDDLHPAIDLLLAAARHIDGEYAKPFLHQYVD